MNKTHKESVQRVLIIAVVIGTLVGTALVATGCGKSAGAAKAGEISPASFKADPSRMSAEERKNYERLTGSKSAPAAPITQ